MEEISVINSAALVQNGHLLIELRRLLTETKMIEKNGALIENSQDGPKNGCLGSKPSATFLSYFLWLVFEKEEWLWEKPGTT